MGYLQQAFNLAVPDAKTPESWYVCLVESVPYYGGPEEGGWWGRDTHLVAYREYASEELALAASQAVHKLAEELEAEARLAHGRQCGVELDWLEARGLDADFLPEPDGPSEYSVYVGNEPPQSSRGCRQYS